jgi:hypothetical protein
MTRLGGLYFFAFALAVMLGTAAIWHREYRPAVAVYVVAFLLSMLFHYERRKGL